MANLTKAAKVKMKGNVTTLNIALSAIKAWFGAMMVIARGTGYAAKPSNTAGEQFMGFSGDNVVDNSGGNAGDLRLDVLQPDFFSPIAWSVTPVVTDVGKRYYFQDDQTVGLTVTANYAGRLAYLDAAGDGYIDARPAYGINPGAAATQTIILPLQLADIAAGVFAINVPFAFTLNSTAFKTAKAATTAAKGATLTPIIGATPVTGGVMTLTSANQTPIGNSTAGTAVTGANTGAANSALGVTASAVTTFVEGDGWVEFNVTNNDL